MEFHLLLLLAVYFIGSQGYGEIPRHLYHGTTPPEQIGADGTCDYGFASHHGMIQSPNFPNRYNNSIDCFYHIYGGKGNIIHIQFWLMSIELHSHCNYDYLLIMNAEEEIVGKYCGQEIPAPINVTETAHLQFHSDFSTNLFGFQIEYFVSHSSCIFGEQNSGCKLPCNCETSAHQLVSCDQQTGQCLTDSCRYREAVGDMIEDSWGGPACQIGNVAYKKTAMQVGTYFNMDASKAVDRHKGQQDQQRYCAHPDSKDKVNNMAAWWTVDLGTVYRVFNVTIYNTWDIGGAKRLEEFSVRYGVVESFSSQEICAFHKQRVENGDHVTLPCDVLTRYISIVREGGVEVTMMTLCEVVVIGHQYTNVDCTRCVGVCAPEIYCDQCQTGYLAPSCRVTDPAIVCGDPPQSPVNGYRIISGTTFGDTVTYECNPGFYVNGEQQLECSINRTWSGTVPRCERVSCGEPPAEPSFGHRFVSGTLYQDVVKFKCDPDYELEGAEEIVCQQIGVWSDSAPICRSRDITCGDPPSIAHGVISPVNGTTYNSLANYVCNGYLMKGSGLLICTVDENWIPYGEESECSDCGGAMEAKEVSTLITHPIDSDKYKHSQNCSWIVYADRPGLTVELTWFHMDLEPHVNCIHDSIVVYDSNGERLHKINRFCGDEILSDMQSVGHMIVLNFMSDETVQMSGFKAEFKAIDVPVDAEVLLDVFYPDLASVLGVTENESGLSSAILYLLDIEIGRIEETPTYVYLVQSIDAVSYLTENVFLPRLQQYFLSAFEHTLSHSTEAKVSDIEVAHKLFREISEPIRALLGYLTVDYGNNVPANSDISCFAQIYKLARHAVGERQSNGQKLVLDITEEERLCVEMIGQTDKRYFLDQMQSGPFNIYTGSLSAQSMYLLVQEYVELAINDAVQKLEIKLSSIPTLVESVISSPQVASVYLEELRIHMAVLIDTIQFFNDVVYDFTENAKQYLANLDLGWKLPQQDQYGRPILRGLLGTLLTVVKEQSLQAQLNHHILHSLPFDLAMSEVRVRHIETLTDELVTALDEVFEGDCGKHKMAALALGFAQEKIVAIAESTVCKNETANSIGDTADIDCDLVKSKALSFYREHLTSLEDLVDRILVGSIHTETIPLGIAFMSVGEQFATLGDFVDFVIKVTVPRFEETFFCAVPLDVTLMAEAFEEFLDRLRPVRALAEDIAVESTEANIVDNVVIDKIQDILEKEFSAIEGMLQPFASVGTYPSFLEAVSKVSAQYLIQAFLVQDHKHPSLDLAPVIDMLERQEVALNDLVSTFTNLKRGMISAMAEQGVDICKLAPQLC